MLIGITSSSNFWWNQERISKDEINWPWTLFSYKAVSDELKRWRWYKKIKTKDKKKKKETKNKKPQKTKMKHRWEENKSIQFSQWTRPN